MNIRQFLRESFQRDPANTGCAVMGGGFVLLALVVVLTQTTDGWVWIFALLVFPVWFLLRSRIG